VWAGALVACDMTCGPTGDADEPWRPDPILSEPAQEYNQSYFSQLIRNFAVFAQQSQVPGPLRATALYADRATD